MRYVDVGGHGARGDIYGALFRASGVATAIGGKDQRGRGTPAP